MTQPELFCQERVGNLTREVPMTVGRITFAPLPDNSVALTALAQKVIVNSGGTVDAKTGKIHAGNIATSKRLQATLAVLKDGLWHTTLDIERVTNSRAVHSDVNALKSNGINYESECMPGRVWKYRLAL